MTDSSYVSCVCFSVNVSFQITKCTEVTLLRQKMSSNAAANYQQRIT